MPKIGQNCRCGRRTHRQAPIVASSFSFSERGSQAGQPCGSLPERASIAFKMSSIHDQQTEDLRFRVLKLLQARPDISQRDLARQLGISHGKMNYCLKALMDKGLVKLENFQNSQHKFNYAYLLTPAGISEKAALTGRFLKRKMAEYEALQAEIEALKAEVGQAATAAAAPCRSSTEP